MALVARESRENDRDTDDVFRRSAFSNASNLRTSATPIRPTTFREDGSSVKLGFGGSDRIEGAVRDTPFRNTGKSVKRGFGGTDVEPGVVRNTPFSEAGTPLRKGFLDFDTPSRAVRNASRSDRIRKPRRARPTGSQTGSPFRVRRGTFTNTGDAFKSPRIASPRSSGRQGDTPVQAAARRLVTRPNRGEQIDRSQDFELLHGPGIAGLTEGAIKQESGKFKSEADPLSGFSVPDLGDEETKAAFNRFFGPERLGFGDEAAAQALRNEDPTRAAFQNRFFPSETFSDVGIGRNRRFRI